MTSTGNYSLKVDDFDSNLVESLKELRDSEDFFDVTLVSDDEIPVQAHKVVLAASSLFFRNIFKFNKNSHPLLYIRGLSDKDLTNVFEFIYTGEIQVAHEELEKFLQIAKDLKLKGMFGNEMLTMSELTPAIQEESPEKVEHKQKKRNKPKQLMVVEVDDNAKADVKSEDLSLHDHDESIVSNIVVDTETDVESTVTATETEVLDAQILEMMFKDNGLWHCKTCEKSQPKKSNMRVHIEINHFDVSQPCTFCEFIAKNRPSLSAHVKTKHTES